MVNYSSEMSTRRQDIGIISVIPSKFRSQCDAITSSQMRAQHLENANEVLEALRHSTPRLLLLAPSVIARDSLPAIRHIVARSRGAITVAMVGDSPSAPEALMELGAAGVRHYVDVSENSAWPRLRGVLSRYEDKTGAAILRELAGAHSEQTSGQRRFFDWS